MAQAETVTVVVQVNGKLREKLATWLRDAGNPRILEIIDEIQRESQDDAESAARASPYSRAIHADQLDGKTTAPSDLGARQAAQLRRQLTVLAASFLIMEGTRRMVQLRLPAWSSYEGPLDLLLELIESRKLDISELSLAQVADQYLAQVASMSPPEGAISPEQADALAAFISIGGRLVLLKARQLLPSPETPPQDEEAANDARELVEMARAYKMYRDGILQLGERDREQLRSYTPISAPPIDRTLPVGMSHDLTLDALARIAQEVLDRAAEREAQEEIAHDAAIERQRITVRERAGDLRARLMSGHALSFPRLDRAPNRGLS